MKQGVVFVFVSAALLAGVAGAHVFAPLPDAAPFQASAKAATPSGSHSSSSSSKPVVEIRQAPVPLQSRERPPVVLPPAVETAAVTPTPQTDMAVESDAGKFAKGAIEADGYRAVKNIAPGPDGTWRARALRGKTEVVLTVDRDGRVSAD